MAARPPWCSDDRAPSRGRACRRRQAGRTAIQVADRFHLSANAGAAMDEVLRSRPRHKECAVVAEPQPDEVGPTPTAPVPPPSQTQQVLAVQRSRRRARWDEVRARRAAGYSIQRIACEMRMHRRTVRPYLATPDVPRNRPPKQPRPSGLTSPMLHPFSRIYRSGEASTIAGTSGGAVTVTAAGPLADTPPAAAMTRRSATVTRCERYGSRARMPHRNCRPKRLGGRSAELTRVDARRQRSDGYGCGFVCHEHCELAISRERCNSAGQ